MPGAVGPLRAELARKAIHVASASIPIAYAAGLPRPTLAALLGALAAVAAVVEVARRRSPRARAAFLAAFGALLREHERDRLSGATWLLAAYALSVALFPRPVAVAAMLAAGLGDAAAAIVGRGVAVARARRGAAAAAAAAVVASRGKTHAGSVACAVVTLAAALFVAALSVPAAVAAAVAASVAERWAPPGVRRVDDNVRVALAAGGAALLAQAAARALDRLL